MKRLEKIQRAIAGEYVNGVASVLAAEIVSMKNDLRERVEKSDPAFAAYEVAELLARWEQWYRPIEGREGGHDA